MTTETIDTAAARRIGPFTVAPIGLGCMNLSHAYGTPPETEDAKRLLLAALDLGVTLFDTAALYGFGANESLVGPVLQPHRSRITLCSKGGMAGVTADDGTTQRVIDGRPESIRRNCEDSLRRLGTDVIDLYYLHRWDKRVPIEESVGAMADLLRAGKLRALGLSEVSAATLRKAHAEHPISAVQSEYSLWSRNPELGVLDACREIGAAFVPFSPLGRAYLTATLVDASTLVGGDIRRSMPRFEPAAYDENLRLLPGLQSLAREVGCTPAQLALAWLLHRGGQVVPIPGTTNETHLRENLGAASVSLDAAAMARLEAHFAPAAITGKRYGAQARSEVDAEEFPAST